jgi:hypothetical protein
VVGLGVVGEDAFDAHAVVVVPAGCAFEEVHAAVRVLAGKELGVGEPRVIVDCDV